MHHHNALQQITLSLDHLTIAGFSISGLATYVQVPELGVVFDLGECPLTALSMALRRGRVRNARRCLSWHLMA